MNEVVFVKLGGSLITDKSKPYTPRFNIMQDLAKQIRRALDADLSLRLLIGNGAGSYGHYAVVKYNLKEGITFSSQNLGFCEVHSAVVTLNNMLVSELLVKSIPAFSITPSSCITSREGKIKHIFLESILGLLTHGIIPVVYGDIVYDEGKGSHIFSTELVFKELITRFIKREIHVDRVIHVGVTDGVYDAEGRIINHIRKNDITKLKESLSKTSGFDVTGGMLHKVEESLFLARKGVKSIIINGTKENMLLNTLLGRRFVGTIIQ